MGPGPPEITVDFIYLCESYLYMYKLCTSSTFYGNRSYCERSLADLSQHRKLSGRPSNLCLCLYHRYGITILSSSVAFYGGGLTLALVHFLFYRLLSLADADSIYYLTHLQHLLACGQSTFMQWCSVALSQRLSGSMHQCMLGTLIPTKI